MSDTARAADAVFGALLDGIDGVISGGAIGDYEAWAARYQSDPVGFWHDNIQGPGPTDYQADILQALVDHRRVAVRSPHGAGKSWLSAVAVWWFLFAFKNSRVITTASVFRQVKMLWAAIHAVAENIKFDAIPVQWSPDYLMKTEIQIGNPYWSAVGVSSNSPEKLEGHHAPAVLVLVDEAKIVPAAVFDSLAGALSQDNAYMLVVSTPGLMSGRFYKIQRGQVPGWWTRHINHQEVIAAGLMAQAWVNECRALWGENSAQFKNRVLGEFADEDSGALIPLSWAEAAATRWNIFAEAIEDGGTPAEALAAVEVWQAEFFDRQVQPDPVADAVAAERGAELAELSADEQVAVLLRQSQGQAAMKIKEFTV